jgi:hypothetical protein
MGFNSGLKGLIYTTVETSSGTKESEFCANTLILESISAYVILGAAKKVKNFQKMA